MSGHYQMKLPCTSFKMSEIEKMPYRINALSCEWCWHKCHRSDAAGIMTKPDELKENPLCARGE